MYTSITPGSCAKYAVLRTRLLIVDAPIVFTMWMTSWRMKTVKRMEGMIGKKIEPYRLGF